MEALTGLPPLQLVIQGEVRSAVYHLWSLGCWSCLHPTRRQGSILMRLQRSDPVFNMEVDVMKPAFNLEPKYRVTMLTREEWTRGPGTPPVVKGLFWFTGESRMTEGTGTGVYGQSLGISLSISQGIQAEIFQAEIYDIMACVYELQMNARPEKYVNTGSDSRRL